MTLVRWEPTRELGTLQTEIDRLFGSVLQAPAAARRRWLPAMDVVETAEEYLLRADLPGLRGADVEVEVAENVLTVSGERKFEQEDTSEGYRRIERASGRFSRSLRLPRGVDPQAVKASFADGVLEVHIPRPQQPKPHRVAVQSGAASETGVPVAA